MKIISRAKINLGLNIVSKRDDGYHNIETVFYPINLFDEIEFIESDTFSIECDKEDIPTDKSNLIWKAKDILQNEIKKEINYKVQLAKRIPSFAGLGGGSSNAAATLKALNELCNINFSKNELRELAAKIGADVPFFLEDKPCFARGRGEELFPLSDFHLDNRIIVVYPGIRISTAWAYAQIKPKQPKFNLSSLKSYNNFIKNKNQIINDFEKVVFQHHPEIAEIKNILMKHGAIYSSLSGSGSAVYGIHSSGTDIHLVKSLLSKYEVIEC
ncbi:MAG: 4-(cytidine 5'-diphospho)-2-C-methyl-D-erythritol kinase [Bacteroidetes bacterium]|nr:4-(cytidine 5'-diphospho)-2-C-methyl-D-erythritol kinase [Bacteroidota bacterium]MBU2583820.1 4-(cytidine 5'-diphospho)-2-C-methyl-D-erythritol kinase [Bacteroidota bacterium]